MKVLLLKLKAFFWETKCLREDNFQSFSWESSYFFNFHTVLKSTFFISFCHESFKIFVQKFSSKSFYFHFTSSWKLFVLFCYKKPFKIWKLLEKLFCKSFFSKRFLPEDNDKTYSAWFIHFLSKTHQLFILMFCVFLFLTRKNAQTSR